jgi:superfamily II DNA helicase RecQ
VASPVVIVVSPLNIIQKDQMFALSKRGITACRLDMKTSICETTDPVQTKVDISSITTGKYSIVFGHPESFLNTEKGRELLRSEELSSRVVAVVIDEVHVVEKW